MAGGAGGEAGPHRRRVTEPSRQRWKVLVLGASMGMIVAPAERRHVEVLPTRTSRQEGTYVEILEWLLRGGAGYPVTVRNSSRIFDQIDRGARRFIEHEMAEFPDVLVIHFGFNECRPPVVPWSLLRHLHKDHVSLSAPAMAYRKTIVPKLWKATRHWQKAASGLVGDRTWRMSPSRFRREYQRLFEIGRRQGMLVLVADVNPPGRRVAEITPGLEERCAYYRRLQAELVDSFGDDDVRLVRVSEVVTEMGIDEALPDNLHFSAPAHQRVAEMLAAEIGPWLDAQGAPHHFMTSTDTGTDTGRRPASEITTWPANSPIISNSGDTR